MEQAHTQLIAQLNERILAADNTPLYIKFAETVKNAVRSGVLEHGNILPGERDLSQLTGVSRITVRKAMQALEEEGVVTRSRGYGTQINNIFEFDDRPVSEVMTHRTELLAFDVNEKISQVIPRAIEMGFSRIPVYEEDIDNIVGILYVAHIERVVLFEQLHIIAVVILPHRFARFKVVRIASVRIAEHVLNFFLRHSEFDALYFVRAEYIISETQDVEYRIYADGDQQEPCDDISERRMLFDVESQFDPRERRAARGAFRPGGGEPIFLQRHTVIRDRLRDMPVCDYGLVAFLRIFLAVIRGRYPFFSHAP